MTDLNTLATEAVGAFIADNRTLVGVVRDLATTSNQADRDTLGLGVIRYLIHDQGARIVDGRPVTITSFTAYQAAVEERADAARDIKFTTAQIDRLADDMMTPDDERDAAARETRRAGFDALTRALNAAL